MIADLLRILLIILLLISNLLIPGLYIGECLLDEFTIIRFLTISILCITQLILMIILYTTKKFKTLLIVFIITTVIIIISFVLEFNYLSNFIDNGRQRFIELMDMHPDGSKPFEWRLILPYLVIKNEKCCGIDSTELTIAQSIYFAKFPSNCGILSFFNEGMSSIYQNRPCMNIVHHSYEVLHQMTIIKIIMITLVMIVFGIYVFLCRQQKNRTMINPSHMTINNPDISTNPIYPDISQYNKK